MSSLNSESRQRLTCWLLVSAFGLVQALAHRHFVNPDGISYIEMGRYVAEGHFAALVNAYWSPLYPFLLGCAFRFTGVSLFWESTAVHLVNFVIGLGTYACLEFFLREILAARNSLSFAPRFLLNDAQLRWAALLFYLWSTYFWLGAKFITPDGLVAAEFLLATALLLRLSPCPYSLGGFAFFGGVLALGYLTKTVNFLLAFVFLFVLFLLVRNRHGAPLRVLASAAAFLALSAPLVLGLSLQNHRLTFGDSGRINYVEFVGGLPHYLHWQGDEPCCGKPLHPTRQIWTDPPVFEFATPIAGSYPPWYDPSYWYDGARAPFLPAAQAHTLFRSANEYLKLVSRSGVLWVLLFALILLGRPGGGLHAATPPSGLVLLPGVAMASLYALVHVEERFLAGFGLVLLVWLLARFVPSPVATPRRVRVASGAVLLALVLAIAAGVFADARALLRPAPFDQWNVAQGLRAAGAEPGTHVALMGDGLNAYWAHLAGLRVIAELPPLGIPRYLSLAPFERAEIFHRFASTGARFLLSDSPGPAISDPDWQRVPATTFLYRRLPSPSENNPSEAPRLQ